MENFCSIKLGIFFLQLKLEFTIFAECKKAEVMFTLLQIYKIIQDRKLFTAKSWN